MPLSFVAPLAALGGEPYVWNQRMAVEHGDNVYFFYKDVNADLAYRKSTNRGKSFAAPVIVASATIDHHSIWFDRWTPGETGTVIHIALIDNAVDDVIYYSLDTATDTLSAPVTIFAGASATAGATQCTIAKSRGGNLLCVFNIDGGTEIGSYRSVDAGVNWTARADANEVALDLYILFPGNDADNQDMWLIYWDISANEISLKVYDDSANSWSETSISASMTEAALSAANPQFNATIRATDGHILMAAWSDRDVATADLKTWDINGAASIVAKTDIVTNADDCQLVHLARDGSNNVYATYAGKSDGSQVIGTSLGLYRKISRDGMATWEAEQAYYEDHLSIIEAISGSLITVGFWPLTFWSDGDIGAGQMAAMTAWAPIPYPVVGVNSSVVRAA